MTCQPLKLVSDIGELGSANATSAVTSAQTVKTGVLYVVCSDARAAGDIAVCNTANQAGVGSFHVCKGDNFLYRYGHPARGTVTAASKAASDHLIKSYFRTYDLPVIITNCTNNYGPKQFPEKLIPKTITNILNNVYQ